MNIKVMVAVPLRGSYLLNFHSEVIATKDMLPSPYGVLIFLTTYEHAGKRKTRLPSPYGVLIFLTFFFSIFFQCLQIVAVPLRGSYLLNYMACWRKHLETVVAVPLRGSYLLNGMITQLYNKAYERCRPLTGFLSS